MFETIVLLFKRTNARTLCLTLTHFPNCVAVIKKHVIKPHHDCTKREKIRHKNPNNQILYIKKERQEVFPTYALSENKKNKKHFNLFGICLLILILFYILFLTVGSNTSEHCSKTIYFDICLLNLVILIVFLSFSDLDHLIFV